MRKEEEMIIDFNNIDTSKATKLPILFTPNCHDNKYSLEIRNFKAGRELHDGAFKEFIALRCGGVKLSLINVDLSECKNQSRLFRRMHVNELQLMNVMFCDNADLSEYFHMSSVNKHNLSELDLSKVTNISSMFDTVTIPNLDVSNWDTRSLVKASWSFANYSTDTMNLSKWNTSKLENTNSMFEDCNINTLILDWENTENLTEMSQMFAYTQLGYLGLRNMNMSRISSRAIFMGSNIKSLDFRGATLPSKDILIQKYWFNGATIENIIVDKDNYIDIELFKLMHNKPNIIVEPCDNTNYKHYIERSN